MTNFNHFNEKGEAHMVDVGHKAVTHRKGIAEGRIVMQPATFEKIQQGGHRKGDVLAVAQLAGIMAAKKTADLIPLCHPLSLTKVAVDFELDAVHHAVVVRAQAETVGQTGVEMEALCAVSGALLTIYDMCKAVDRAMTIEGVQLVEKTGGKSGIWQRDGDQSAS